MEKPVEERIKYVQQENLCFGCLKIGHNSKACTSRSVCDSCEKRHLTCLHQEREKKDREQGVRNKHESKETKGQESKETEIQQATSNRVVQEKSRIHTSSIVPVFVSTMEEPDKGNSFLRSP